MSDVKTKDLVTLEVPELLTRLEDLKSNLVSLRAKQQSVRAGEIKRVRKSIARTLTIYNLKRREEVRALATASTMPKDLRAKKTRAIRRRLSPEEANAKTEKSKKKATTFPKRRYAIKA